MDRTKQKIARSPGKAFHALSADEVLKILSSTPSGLSSKEAVIRLKKYGTNEIPDKGKKSPVLLFLKQFHSVLVYILIGAAVIAGILDHIVDVYVIAAVIVFNAIMGFVQEYKAERAIEALKKMVSPHAKVYRDGKLIKIDAKELIPGDTILLEAGDRIPADARVIEAKNLRTQEASLTGESAPVSKNTERLPKNTGLADKENMVWLGTFVAGGQGKAVIVATGANTALGQIAKSIGQIKKTKSHFEQRVNVLGKKAAILAISTASLTFLIGYFFRGIEFGEIFLFTVASLVSGIPEGLPAILVVVLAIGARKMAKRSAIVRTLPSGETLGVASVIVTDKTGTITQNTMTVEKVVLPDGKMFAISGEGWSNKGEFFENDVNAGSKADPLKDNSLNKLLHIAAVCNNAQVSLKGTSKKEYSILGDPTEAGLVVLAEKAGLTKENVVNTDTKLDDFPFNEHLRYRGSLVETDKKTQEIYIVGAPETILNKSASVLAGNKIKKITEQDKLAIHTQTEQMAQNTLRVLSLAYKEVPKKTSKFPEDSVGELVFVGLVGMKDPARPEVTEAIQKAKNAGVHVIMATGDHKETAFAIAKEIKLIESNSQDISKYVKTEKDLEALSASEFKKVVAEVSIFARLTPNMKLKIADALQKQGHVVAMTGDGVNDAPALKQADIGIAMGVMGTDVAREASNLILADDNFATIVSAIEEGRIIFNNTRIASFFLVSTNFAEGATIISALLFGLPLPLLATQILWLNLVTDGVAGVPLAAEPGHGDILSYPPRKKKEDILNKEILPFFIIMVVIMAVATLAAFKYHLPDIERARTAAFTVMAFTQLFKMFTLRSLRKSIFEIGWFSNKYIVIGFVVSVILQVTVMYNGFFQRVFRFASLNIWEFVALVAISSLTLWFGELYKYIRRRYNF